MRKTSLFVALAVLIICSVSASAQDEFVGRDILEVNFFGGIAAPTGGISDWQTGFELNPPNVVDRAPKTGFDVGIDIGYFVTPAFILGFDFKYRQFAVDVDEDGGQKHRFYNPNLYAKYLFEGESYFVPYIKGHVGIENPKFSTWVYDRNVDQRKFRELSYDPAFAFGAGAGLFYYTADFSGIYIEADYHYAMTDEAKATYQDVEYKFRENTSVISVNAGIRILIGSGE